MSLINKKILILLCCALTLLMISYVSLRLNDSTEAGFQNDRKRLSYRKKAILRNPALNNKIQKPLFDKPLSRSSGNRENNTSGELSYGEYVKIKQLNLDTPAAQYLNHSSTAKQKDLVEYLVETKDPRSERLIKKLYSTISDDVYQKLFTKIKRIEEAKHITFRNLPFQKQWKVLIATMKELGYEQRLPNVINIGSKKSGTNAFGFFFQQHPQVCHSLGNEVHYFDWNHEKGTAYYKSRMGFATGNQFSFEKTPRYFVTEDAPFFMLEELPEDIKFILCVRDPVDRAISDFRHESELTERRNLKGRINHSKYLSKDGQMQGLKFQKLVMTPNGEVNASNEIIQTSLYSKHLKNWLKYYSRDRFLVINHDNLQDDAYNELKRVETFLGLKPYFTKDMFYYDEKRHGSCMKGKPRPCPAKSTPGFLPKAQLSPYISQKLHDFYRPYNNEFSKLIGQRFDWMDR
ncbi:heparan sulfate glucosamine 3-O-sulfotransferase 6-like [Antedon mediterranea]|uniref:heparan sulfate glucosamine 3-O-sulfotransferase 6-like n=1 Tax=Antedon mediterranea TaxID=105859 RepID=UPI003AF839F0